MDSRETKRTVPYPSVGADGEQPISQTTTPSIAEEPAENKSQDERMEDILRELQRTSDPAYLHTVSMNELYQNVYQSRPPIIDGLLYPGTYLFAGAPKVGKSFLIAQIAYHTSMGVPLWKYPVRKGTVLYLALEDDYHRLQERLYRMFGTDGADNLFFSVSAGNLGNGLDEQLQEFMKQHTDTRLIIIDTLQKVREVGGDNYSYANDYEVITRLKQFADSYGICILLVHHTRKQPAGDSFETISGTTGLLGCADGAILMQKEKRTDNKAALDIVGRDQPDQKIHLIRDEVTLQWNFEKAERQLWKEPPDPILTAVAKLVTAESPQWKGSATELAEALQMTIQPNALSKKLNVKAGKLMQEFQDSLGDPLSKTKQ